MRAVAETVDLGVRTGIADEYVNPLRITVKAMTDNLLPHDASAQARVAMGGL